MKELSFFIFIFYGKEEIRLGHALAVLTVLAGNKSIFKDIEYNEYGKYALFSLEHFLVTLLVLYIVSRVHNHCILFQITALSYLITVTPRHSGPENDRYPFVLDTWSIYIIFFHI